MMTRNSARLPCYSLSPGLIPQQGALIPMLGGSWNDSSLDNPPLRCRAASTGFILLSWDSIFHVFLPFCFLIMQKKLHCSKAKSRKQGLDRGVWLGALSPPSWFLPCHLCPFHSLGLIFAFAKQEQCAHTLRSCGRWEVPSGP